MGTAPKDSKNFGRLEPKALIFLSLNSITEEILVRPISEY